MIAKVSKVILQRLNGISTKLRVYQNPSKLKYRSEETIEEINIWIKKNGMTASTVHVITEK